MKPPVYLDALTTQESNEGKFISLNLEVVDVGFIQFIDIIVTLANYYRLRVPIHYLSSGSLSMSSEEISLLSRCNSYQKSSLSC